MPRPKLMPSTRRAILLGLTALALGLGYVVLRSGRPADKPLAVVDEASPDAAVASGSSADAGSSPTGVEEPTSGPPSHVELEAALAAIQAESDDDLQEAAWERLEEQMAAAGLPDAVRYCLRSDASDAERELGRRLLRRWAEADAAKAGRWVAWLPEGPERRQAIAAVATVWADADLPAAIRWASGLPAGEDRQGAVLGIAYEAARTEPVEALALALELPEDRLRDDLLAHAAAQCATLAPAEAAAMAAEFPDALLRDRLLGAIATAWADTDPRAAANLALTAVGTPRLRDDAVISIVQRWVQKDPEAAAAWVDTFPEGPLRETALENVQKLRPASAAETAPTSTGE